jgi:hypothetical protein
MGGYDSASLILNSHYRLLGLFSHFQHRLLGLLV